MEKQAHSASPASPASEETIYHRHRDASFTRFGGEGLLVVPRSAMQIVLNDTGARVFEMLEEGDFSARSLAERLSQEYENSDSGQVRRDVLEVLEELRAQGAVEIVE